MFLKDEKLSTINYWKNIFYLSNNILYDLLFNTSQDCVMVKLKDYVISILVSN